MLNFIEKIQHKFQDKLFCWWNWVQWNCKLNKIYLNIFTIKKSSNQNNNNLNLIIRFMIGLDIYNYFIAIRNCFLYTLAININK